MCGERRPSSSAAWKPACILETLDMPMMVTDKTDRSSSRQHGSSGEHASDVLTKPTEGLRWFLPGEVACRGPREQPRMPTGLVALSGPVLSGPRGAPRWAVGQRTPPGRTGLRIRRPGGPGRRFWAFGANRRGVVDPAAGPDAIGWGGSDGHDDPACPVCRQAGGRRVTWRSYNEHRASAAG